MDLSPCICRSRGRSERLQVWKRGEDALKGCQLEIPRPVGSSLIGFSRISLGDSQVIAECRGWSAIQAVLYWAYQKC